MAIRLASRHRPLRADSGTAGNPRSGRDPGRALRLAYVTQWFPPEVEGVPLSIAQTMREQGFHVGVVTGVPHYPTGTPFPGYRARDWKRDSVDGFPLMRVPEFPSHDTSALRRMATFGSFAASGAGLAAWSIGRADVSLVYSSPATAALPAMVARAQYGTPYVLVVQDLWPDSVFATGFLTGGSVQRLAQATMDVFVRRTYRAASHICVITPGMRRTLVSRGVPEERITVVYNWVDESIYRPVAATGELRRTLGLGEADFIALYAGNAGEAQGLAAWVHAMATLRDLADVHLVLLGGGTQTEVLRAMAADHGVGDNVHFLGHVPGSQVPSLTADSDVSVVSLADRPLFEITMPSKVQACLAMARPVVASVAGDAADVVSASGAGWVARPEDPGSIADALRSARATPPLERLARGRWGHESYRATMSREIGSARLAGALRAAAAEARRR